MRTNIAIIASFIILSSVAFGGPLDGTWINTDAATRSIPKIEITSTQFVWWGKTHPENSRYGPLTLTLLGDSVGDPAPDKYGFATQDSGFANEFFFVKLSGSQLVVETLTVFKDGSKRANYHQTLTFAKQR
ncbi:MAG: hypothetical protein WCF18_06545 [Chthoniobacteraceae bacterium]